MDAARAYEAYHLTRAIRRKIAGSPIEFTLIGFVRLFSGIKDADIMGFAAKATLRNKFPLVGSYTPKSCRVPGKGSFSVSAVCRLGGFTKVAPPIVGPVFVSVVHKGRGPSSLHI